MSIERRMRERVHYGWIVVAVTFVTLLAAAGIRSAPGVLMIPLEREFGWTRATVSFAVSINLFLYGLSGPFIAGLMDRLGIRRVMVTSLALVATGVALTTLMTASWQLALLWGVVVGLGTGTMASVLGAMVANRWFTERRGVVLGLLTASSVATRRTSVPAGTAPAYLSATNHNKCHRYFLTGSTGHLYTTTLSAGPFANGP